MFCRKCGAELADDALFCAHCGEKVIDKDKETAEETAIVAEAPSEPEAVEEEPKEEKPEIPAGATPVMIFGIASLVCALSTFAVYIIGPLLGVILGAIARSLGKKYIKTNGDVSARVRIGRTLGLAGLIVGLVLTVLEGLSLLILLLGMFLGIFVPILGILAAVFGDIGASGMEAFVYSLMDMIASGM